LSTYLDYNLVTANQTALVKNVVSTQGGSHMVANFSYELTAAPNLGDPAVVAAVASPAVTLPTGRYEVTISNLGPHWIEVYPNSVIWADNRRLLPGMVNSNPPVRALQNHATPPYGWRFVPASDWFHYWMPQRESGVKVSLQNRVK
jgi:hypothetical protein